MLSFTIHEAPNPPADRIDRAEALVFVKDGFSWMATLFTPVWMLVHRLWWPLLAYIVASGAFDLIMRWADIDRRWAGLGVLALNLVIGFEAGTLRRWQLRRRGWRMLGAIVGKTLAESERRFFEAWLPTQSVIAPASGASRPLGPKARSSPVIGSLLGAQS